jgi:hypothetical protein
MTNALNTCPCLPGLLRARRGPKPLPPKLQQNQSRERKNGTRPISPILAIRKRSASNQTPLKSIRLTELLTPVLCKLSRVAGEEETERESAGKIPNGSEESVTHYASLDSAACLVYFLSAMQSIREPISDGSLQAQKVGSPLEHTSASGRNVVSPWTR